MQPLKESWLNFIKSYNWSLFVTLTFRYPVTTIWGCQAKVRGFSDEVTNPQRNALSYIYFAEPHASGLWHVHGLLRRINYSLWHVPEGRRVELSTYLHEIWHNYGGGRARFSELGRGGKAFKYMVKYLTKDSVRAILDMREV